MAQTKTKHPKPAKEKTQGRGRNVYFRNTALWDDLAKLAAKQDRSVNFLLEHAANEMVTKQ